jgi:hypothetical protein
MIRSLAPDETAALTKETLKVEKKIDERVAVTTAGRRIEGG